MSGRTVRLAPRARAQADRIEAWWRANRTAAPELFVDELEAAIARLRLAPESGLLYTAPGLSRIVRRLVLPRTRYHLYYAIGTGGESITVLAVWHATRGQAPRV